MFPSIFSVMIYDGLESTVELGVIWNQTSVADPGCLSRIPDPKTATKERGKKKFDVIPFYVATNFTKLYIILVLKC